MKIFDEHYDNNGFDKSQYNDFSKKHLVIEAEYMHDVLWSILKYLNSGGTDIDVIRAEVMDGIYESRI